MAKIAKTKNPKIRDFISSEDFRDIQELAVLPLVLLKKFPEYNECSFCSLHNSKSEFYYKKYCKDSSLNCSQKRYNYHKDNVISRNSVLKRMYNI